MCKNKVLQSFINEKEFLLTMKDNSSTDEWNAIKEDYLNRLRDFILVQNINEHDGCNVTFGIRHGTGGDEAKIFAENMFKAYLGVFEYKKWLINDVLQPSSGNIQCKISGKQVYKILKYESGIHRVQRVPDTEKKGRIHTSTVAVFCIPDIYEEDEIIINDKDLRIDCFRSGGKGGQNVNKVSSAVRIVHLPTKISVESQKERNQLANRQDALERLKVKLREYYGTQKQSAKSDIMEKQLGQGHRNEKIRTYDFSSNKICDHRINLSVNNLTAILLRGHKFLSFMEEVLFRNECTLFDLYI